jgi:leukotriene-A4 hydrolase
MLQRRLLLILTTVLFLVAARQRSVRHPVDWPLGTPPADIWSSARPSEVTTKHISLDLTVDFEQRVLRGTATLDIENLTGTNTLALDTYELNVTSVTLDGATPAQWTYGAQTEDGRPMNITIEPDTDSVTIAYSTTPFASGLFWNTPAQSYGRVQPYLYTLNEPVQARSWIPSQDTPTVRSTFDATIRVPRGMLALMGAIDNATEANDTGVYTFTMNYPVPSYLIALAAGRLEFRALDERTGVYAEPELIDDAAWELQYLPEMVDVAEDIAGEFPFTRHDVLLMPPTFVVGGMEHPMLNFVDSSTITRNRPADPLPSTLVAHELAHSWAGDSATLANWNDVWINEGITTYLTHRIIEVMSGPERAEYGYFNDRRNYASYATNVEPEDTILHRAVPYPGAAFDSTSYVKGGLFIKTLEDHIGRARFDEFLQRYFRTFAYRWVDHQQFTAFLRATVLTPQLEQQVRLAQWLYEPGLPSNVTAAAQSAVSNRVQQRAAAFAGGTHISQLQPGSWTQVELELFLSAAPTSVLRARMAEVDAAFGLSARTTPPLTWLTNATRAGYAPANAAVERALMRGGPTGWVLSLYNALAQTDRNRGIDIYNRARGRYRDDIEEEVLRILGLNSAKGMKTAA